MKHSQIFGSSKTKCRDNYTFGMPDKLSDQINAIVQSQKFINT